VSLTRFCCSEDINLFFRFRSIGSRWKNGKKADTDESDIKRSKRGSTESPSGSQKSTRASQEENAEEWPDDMVLADF